MNREQLEAIAKELDIKVTKKLDDENLAYAIIDAEARAESAKVNDAPEKPKARRGRPPKEKAAEKTAEKAEKPAEAAPAEAAKERKPKQKASKKEQPAPAQAEAEAAQPEQKAGPVAEAPAADAPKKRGRKPKAAAAQDAPAAPEKPAAAVKDAAAYGKLQTAGVQRTWQHTACARRRPVRAIGGGTARRYRDYRRPDRLTSSRRSGGS